MAENKQLTAFLAEESRGQVQEPPPAPEPAPAPEPKPTPEPTPPAREAKPDAKPTPEPEDDDQPPARPLEGEDGVAFRAFEDERKKRQDWKERAIKAETKAEADRQEWQRRLDELARGPVQSAAYIPPPDPSQDPQGYHQRVQSLVLNERLNTSEMLLREKVGDAAVDALINEFQQAAKADPSLYGKLYQQTRPYQWAAKEVEAMRLRRDIGDDPAAYRARIEAEARAKWEAEAAQRQPALPNGTPIPAMQPSLANARSAAPRSAGAWSGPLDDDGLIQHIRADRKRG
jgi:hypothetical protein